MEIIEAGMTGDVGWRSTVAIGLALIVCKHNFDLEQVAM
jgi:hypothetical protein